jgi:hypothetical protein
MAERVGLTKFKLNSAGVRALLCSGEVLADLEGRGRSIAAAAGPGMEVDARIGSGRARVSVRTATNEARRAEATDRRLTRAIDAGR